MLTAKVRYDELRPDELAARLRERAVAYLPLGTLEWHGDHLPFGVDAIISEGLMFRCAQKYGGVVLPPLHLGPDRARLVAGELLTGMDYDATTAPPRALPGSAYWIPEGLFMLLIEHLLAQLKRAGFRGVFADGHGPSRWCWARNQAAWSERFGLALCGVTPEVELTWKTQTDHAGRNETSLVLAIRKDLVDLGALRDREAVGVAGAPPEDATPSEGEALLAEAVERVEELLRAAGV